MKDADEVVKGLGGYDTIVLGNAREVLAEQSDDDRMALWIWLMDGYCRNCGRKHPDYGMCQCENDE